MTELTADRVRELLHYEPDTGVFKWRARSASVGRGGSRVRVGQIAGAITVNGYRAVKVAGRTYTMHRLAWLYVYGAWPGEIDHINHDKADNRISNLRECSHAQNKVNVRSKALSGYKGVSPCGGKWQAGVFAGRKKRLHLGVFGTREEAALAHATAAYGLFGPFAFPHWRDLLAEIRGTLSTGWRKPRIEELSLSREEMDRLAG